MSHNISIKTFSRTKFLITAISLLMLASRLHAEDATAPGSVTAPLPDHHQYRGGVADHRG